MGLEKPNLGLDPGKTFFPNSVSVLDSAETFQISRNPGLDVDENVCLLDSQPWLYRCTNNAYWRFIRKMKLFAPFSLLGKKTFAIFPTTLTSCYYPPLKRVFDEKLIFKNIVKTQTLLPFYIVVVTRLISLAL